jgi:uncharacterized protein (DUF1330 family)
VPAYIIVDIDVNDPEQFKQYQAKAGPTVQQYGGKFTMIGTGGEALEGEWAPKALASIEFVDAAAARRWYDSPEYVEARKLRQGAARLRFALMQGPER